MPTDQPKQLVQPSPTTPQAETPLPEPVLEPIFIRLPLGEPLTESEALELAADRSIRIVVLAGAVACGKTTLLTSLYELFQSGPIKTIQFSESQTLPAFERRCHLSRIESERQVADTSRTPYEGPHPEYLHLKVDAGTGGEEFVDFLFTDISGEMFEHARNSTDECKEFTFLSRADHFLVFLDSEKALIADKKWDMVQEVKTLLQSCLDSAVLKPTCKCMVVWSKCDYFEATKDKASVEKFVRDVESDLRTSFPGLVNQLRFHRTAARPSRYPDLKMGFGVRELLDEWICHCPQARAMQLEPPIENGGSRESERFAKRHHAVEDRDE